MGSVIKRSKDMESCLNVCVNNTNESACRGLIYESPILHAGNPPIISPIKFCIKQIHPSSMHKKMSVTEEHESTGANRTFTQESGVCAPCEAKSHIAQLTQCLLYKASLSNLFIIRHNKHTNNKSQQNCLQLPQNKSSIYRLRCEIFWFYRLSTLKLACVGPSKCVPSSHVPSRVHREADGQIPPCHPRCRQTSLF